MNTIRGLIETVDFHSASVRLLLPTTEFATIAINAWWWEHTAPLFEVGLPIVFHTVENVSKGVYTCGMDARIVIEPSIVVDVTEISGCFMEAGPSPKALRLVQALYSERTSATVVGTMVNAVADIMLRSPSTSDDELLRLAAHQSPLQNALMALKDNEWPRVLQRTRNLIPALRHGFTEFGGGSVVAEPTYIAPDLGMQGRFDFMVRSPDNSSHYDIIELKSGAAPKPSENLALAIRPAHLAQVVAYDMILRGAVPLRTGRSMVWYPSSSEQPFRTVGKQVEIERQIVTCRNVLVSEQRAIATRRKSVFEVFNRDVAMLLPEYSRNEALDLVQGIHVLSETERLYTRAWLAFLAAEARCVYIKPSGVANPRELSIEQKRESDACLTNLEYDHSGSDADRLHLRFKRSRQPAETSLRFGDLVTLHPMPSSDSKGESAGAIQKATIREIDDLTVTISLRNKSVGIDEISRDTTWKVERDLRDSGIRSLQTSLLSIAQIPAMRRRIMLGIDPPRTGSPRSIEASNLYPQQKAVVEQALACKDWFLIQGPPGTGKTSTVVRTLVQQLMLNPAERVLLLAFTNRAADEIAAVIEDALGPESYVRLASKDNARGSVSRHLQVLAATRTAPELAHVLHTSRCVVSTLASLQVNSDLLSSFTFTTAIIDEASQVIEPQIIGIAARVARCILIGDVCQLPAVIVQDNASLLVNHPILHALQLRSLGMSYFERLLRCALANGWHHCIGTLTDQARMHDRIGSVASSLFYGGQLNSVAEWQREAAPWRSVEDRFVNEIFTHRLVNFDTSGFADSAVADAYIVVRVAEAILEACDYDVDIKIGIISPFRAQNNRIKNLLPQRMVQHVQIDTVERFQGSERDIIILAASVSSITDLEGMQSEATTQYGVVDRKLNVAITRARNVCIVVGSHSVLQQAPSWSALLSHSTEMQIPSHFDIPTEF